MAEFARATLGSRRQKLQRWLRLTAKPPGVHASSEFFNVSGYDGVDEGLLSPRRCSILDRNT